jgi:hypothetical protein
MPLWETRNNGNFRVVRLTRRFALKTPRILEFIRLKCKWRQYGNPASKPSIAWRLNTWFKLFRQNRLVNEEETRTYQEWQRKGAHKIAGLGLCPILFHFPRGFSNVMPRAAPVPPDRVNKDQDPLSNGAVTFAEMKAAAILMGRNSDTCKADTFGFVSGELVVVDYGWLQPSKV